MEPSYPEPIGEALSYSSQRAAPSRCSPTIRTPG